MSILLKTLPIPEFFAPQQVKTIYRVPYQERAIFAKDWAKKYNITPASQDQKLVGLLAIDVQNTFCLPDFELFVGGRSQTGAVDDSIRLCEFIYRHLNLLTEIMITLDTHKAAQIFHPIFWVDSEGKHPQPHTIINLEDVESGRWQVNPEMASTVNYDDLQQYGLHYVKQLTENSKLPLTIWPYHAMLGGIGHAVVSAIEEACFIHSIARHTQTHFEIKGDHPLTENYSALSPEVRKNHREQTVRKKNDMLIEKLLEFDALIIAGEAKSHCVTWTVDDLLLEIKDIDPKLAQKIYLLEDCSSPVVVPDVIDFTEQADITYQRFAEAGMHLVNSQQPIESWLKI